MRNWRAAEIRLSSTVIALHEKLEASADALVGHVESACPGVVPASLQTGSKAQQRTWTALVDGASAALNRRVAGYEAGERVALSLHPPDLCEQARAAARSGFTVVPAGIKRLGHQQSRIDRLLGGFVFGVFGRLTQAPTGVSVSGA